MSGRPFHYRVFGLTLASDLELPELPPLPHPAEPDLHVELGALPRDLPSLPGYYSPPDGGLLVIEGAGRFLARDGRTLLIEPAADVPERNLRLYLLGSGLGMIIHQRGLLPLHANAVVIDDQAFAFTGPSGAGKSTLAAWFVDHGFQLLCDDVCVIGFDEGGRAVAWPGLPRLRLWEDALKRSGRDAATFQRSFVEDASVPNKFDVPLAQSSQPTNAYPLGGVILLDRGEHWELEQRSSAEALATLFSNIYRGEYLTGAQHEAVWRTCLQIAATVPVRRWTRPWRLGDYDDQIARLLQALKRS